MLSAIFMLPADLQAEHSSQMGSLRPVSETW